MATPEEINDRLLVGYVPTYILVMVRDDLCSFFKWL